MADPQSIADLTDDAFLGGRLRLYQSKSGHRAGHDAVLLAAATPARPGDRIVEFGAGVGAAGLMLARRVGAIDLVLIDIDPGAAALARGNAVRNGIHAGVAVFDVTSGAAAFRDAGLDPDSADGVLMNPPFNEPARHRASPDEDRARAHVADESTLESWIGAARRLLKSGGVLTLIWRADALADVLTALSRGFGSFEILPVHGKSGAPAIRIIVRARKGGRSPAQLHRGIVLDGNDAVVARVMHGDAALMASMPGGD